MNLIHIIVVLAASLKLSFELFPILQISLSALSGFLQVATNFVNSVVGLLATLVTLIELIKKTKKEPKRNRTPRKFR